MTMRDLLAPIIAPLVLALAMLGCSTSPTQVTDGGTHTGNPDVSACAAALEEIADAGDAWHVYSYLDTSRLDPASIDPAESDDAAAAYQNTLAKRRGAGDTVIVETVLVYDTLLVNDTLVRRNVVADTVDTLIGTDTLLYVNRRLVTDTLIAIDSVIVVDTFVLADTIPIAEFRANDTLIDSAAMTDTIYSMEYLSVVGDGYYPDATNSSKFNIYPGSSSDVVSRSGFYMTAAGAAVTVEYADADGDNYLFSAKPGITPSIALRESRALGTDGIYMHSRYDAGVDSIITSVGDNRITSLVQYTVASGDTTQATIYSMPSLPQASDDEFTMTVGVFAPMDSVDSSSTRYTILAGSDLASAVDDKLSGISKSAYLTSSTVRSVDVAVTPASLLARGDGLGEVSFDAEIVQASGDTTHLNGTYNPRTGIAGEYIRNDSTFTVKLGAEGEYELTAQ
ncbi:MAG: hypothetical protein GF418_16235 [Chitinivibrionales bacterium]|nr:hypothetical protein [Chitinivibrionales bacterium]MBD3397170.1 hypothetical protein [Chitinivibrionales bacterium]